MMKIKFLLSFTILVSTFTNHCMQDISLKKVALQTVVASAIILSQMLPVAATSDYCIPNNSSRFIEVVKLIACCSLWCVVLPFSLAFACCGDTGKKGECACTFGLFAAIAGIVGVIGVAPTIIRAPICGG